MGGVGPLPDGADVDMDESTFRVIAYAASRERHRSITQRRGRDTGHAKVERLGLDVLRMQGCVGGSALAQHVVSLLGAIGGEDVNRAVGLAQLREHRVKHVEGARIIVAYLFVMAVAEKIVQLVKRIRDVGVADAVDDAERFAGVGTDELQLILLAVDRKLFFIVRKQTDAGKGDIYESAREGMVTRMPAGCRPGRSRRCWNDS